MTAKDWASFSADDSYKLTQAEFKGATMQALKDINAKVDGVMLDFKNLELGRLTNVENRMTSTELRLQSVVGTGQVVEANLAPTKHIVDRVVDLIIQSIVVAIMGLIIVNFK